MWTNTCISYLTVVSFFCLSALVEACFENCGASWVSAEGGLVDYMFSQRQLGASQGVVPPPCHQDNSPSHLLVQMENVEMNNAPYVYT